MVVPMVVWMVGKKVLLLVETMGEDHKADLWVEKRVCFAAVHWVEMLDALKAVCLAEKLADQMADLLGM